MGHTTGLARTVVARQSSFWTRKGTERLRARAVRLRNRVMPQRGAQDPAGGDVPRRQRFLNLVRATRDAAYSNLGGSGSASGPEASGGAEECSTSVERRVPANMALHNFPLYATAAEDGGYVTRLHLQVRTPANPASRRSRLTISALKQYLKPAEDSNELRHRMDGFFQQQVPRVPVIVDLLGSDASWTHLDTTDAVGNVQVTARTDFIPLNARVTLDTPADYPQLVSQVYNLPYIKREGFALISDIDDTIKHTGVTGNIRSIIRNVFLEKPENWLIDGMPRWYRTLRDTANVDFFYVSNSPIQLYPVLSDYIAANYPMGPISLKQYSGNLFSGITTSSANRKIGAIQQILADFPAKKFILVGDSGEKDLEAYSLAASKYPNQIIAIYIRSCSNSMSDGGHREEEVLKSLNRLIDSTYKNFHASSTTKPKVPPRPASKDKPTLSDEQRASIIRSRLVSDSATIMPKGTTPPLPKRPVTSTGLPTRNSTDPNSSVFEGTTYMVPSTQNDDGSYSTYFDKKEDDWHIRVKAAMSILMPLNIAIMFFRDPEMGLEDSIARIRNNQR